VVEAVNSRFPRLRLILAAIIAAIVALPPVAFGHVLDEYLQSTLIVIEPGDIRLKINLTPGTEIAGKVLIRIDPNGDGAVSGDESAAYAEMVKDDLTVRLDGRETQLHLTASNMPDLVELRSGHGIIQMEFSIAPCSFSHGNHRLTLENRHFDSLGVYLVNAARPHSASIRITSQNRNVNQSRGEIEFAYTAPRSLSLISAGLLASAAVVVAGMLTAVRRIKWRSASAPTSLHESRDD